MEKQSPKDNPTLSAETNNTTEAQKRKGGLFFPRIRLGGILKLVNEKIALKRAKRVVGGGAGSDVEV